MKTPLLHALNPFSRIIFSILLVIICFLTLLVIGLLVAVPIFGVNLTETITLLSDFTNPKAIPLLKYFQIIQEFGIFILPPLLAALFFAIKPFHYLKLNNPSRWQAWILTIVIMVSTMPSINLLIELNEAMQLPEWLHGIETWMQEAETQAKDLTEAFLAIDSWGEFIFNVIMIAMLPAIGEELLFRGLLQRLFNDWFKNIHIAIVVAGFLFGAMHLQFYGILPRMALGVLFGYLFYWSGSLWLPIFAHFLNNGVAVTISFMEKQGWIGTRFQDFGSSDNIFITLSSIIITALAMYVFWYITYSRDRQRELP